MLKIRYALKADIPFILQGIREVCRIEMEKPDKKAKLIRLINKAMKKKEIRIVTQDGENSRLCPVSVYKKKPLRN